MRRETEPTLDEIGYTIAETMGYKWAVPPGIRYSAIDCSQNDSGLRDYFRKRCERDLLIDVGSNLGLWAVTMHDRFDKIISIEPSKFCVEIIKKNLELNNITNVTLINRAAWDIETKLKLYQTSHETDFSGGMITTDVDIEMQPFYEVETMTIDSLNISPSAIKINVEGAEFNVLRGSRNTLIGNTKLKKKTFVFVDMHMKTPPFIIKREEINKFMEDCGYKSVWFYDSSAFTSREVYANLE